MPALLVVTLAGVFFPLFSRRGGRPLPVGLDGDPLVQLEQERDLLLRQLKELDLEGDDDPAQGEARQELTKELTDVLARLDTQATQGTAADKETDATSRTRAVDMSAGLAVVVLVAAITAGLYMAMGTPMIVPPRDAPQTQGFPDEVREMVARLAERLQGEPDNLEGWLRLARSQAVLGQPEVAMRSYKHILSHHPENMEAVAGLAQLQIQSRDPKIVADGVQIYREMLAKDPDRPDALWTLGLISYRIGEKDKALAMWRRLLSILAADSKVRPMVEKAIREAEGQ